MSKALFVLLNSVWLSALVLSGEILKSKVAAATERAEAAEARYAEVEKHLPRVLEQVKAQGVMTGMEMGCGK